MKGWQGHTLSPREDDGTGLYYYRARYYSPDQKRFIAADPLGFGGGDSNFYAYVGNNPINFTDPTGESFQSFAQGLAEGGASGLVTSLLITAAVTTSGVTIGPLIAAVLALGGGAALIASINAIANEPCPDRRDYLLGALIGGAVGGGLGARLGGRIGAGLKGNAANGGKNYVDGYRAVSKAEADDIAEHGFRPDPSGRSMNDKWFSETRQGADQFRKIFPELQEVVQTRVPKDVYDRSYKLPNIDGTGPGFCVQCADLRLLPKP